MVEIERTALDGVVVTVPRVHRDDRGVFVETFNQRDWLAAGFDDVWVQDNTSVSVEIHTIRGLHFQIPPKPIAKLIRVVRGAVLDVVVDIRRGSPTYGEHVTVRLDADFSQVYVPPGFAHGFCTLEPQTEVAYKVTDHWEASVDRGVAWDDPELGIEWPTDRPIMSAKDAAQPRLEDLPDHFVWSR